MSIVNGQSKDLPSGMNLSDYVDEHIRKQLTLFFGDHKKSFPVLLVLSQWESASIVVELGCECYFGPSGYISSPLSTGLV